MIEINDVLAKHSLWLDSKDGGERADLSGASLRSASLRSADLRSANLRSANLRSANLSGANLIGADLRYTNLSGANLIGADLSGANLSYANLSGANLSGANLSGANLIGANLIGADLIGAAGNLLHLKTIICDTYPVTYTAEDMQIGCQRHAIKDWWNFDDERIVGMDGKTALRFWRKWKPLLQAVIEASPAEPTGIGPASKLGRKACTLPEGAQYTATRPRNR